jgi:hypothetical protein
MPALVAGIHVFGSNRIEDSDGRDVRPEDGAPHLVSSHSEVGASLDTPANRTLNPGPIGRFVVTWALSSAGERSLHTGEVVGSIPTAPTTQSIVCSIL